MLAGYGVTHVFMVPAVLRASFAEMERRTGIKRIHAHGEKAAAYMADGYARASGRPGVCMAQVIGALNLAAGLRDAWLAYSPVIAFTGGREPKTQYRKVYQEINDMPAFEPVTKFNATVDAAERFPDMIAQAFRVAVSGSPGPVHLQFRGNEGQVDAEEADMSPRIETQFARVPPFRPAPEQAAVAAALTALQRASRPAIVAGGGVRASGVARELVALAEKLAIPVATSLNGMDSIQGLCGEWREKYRALLASDAVPMRPERLCADLSATLPEDAIVMVDTGHAGMWMGGMFDLCSPAQSYIRSAGHLGWAFPAGIGAKAACPERPVVVFTGDAGFWNHIAEIETAVRWGINSVTVVNNNGGGNQSKRGFDRAYGGEQTEQARELWTFSKVNFARIAEDMGALGIRVERPADFVPALERALKAGLPVVIDAVTDIEALAPLAVT
ncbi:MAG: hypothetical protein A3H35_13535 [Betaproteobacteria bacterium RIFCSPLOWO2_02_FULL_62_17]|nr:MAG: hypothetical protein A3H35_13535 [Betaproteobacteria bacterium RIFCSPLOWO2_02_FULL_62_17]